MCYDPLRGLKCQKKHAAGTIRPRKLGEVVRYPSEPGSVVRAIAKIAVLVAVILLVNRYASDLAEMFKMDIDADSGATSRMVLTAAAFYAVFLAFPFVPAAEIGFTLLGLLGSQAVPLVYGATVVGLCLAFAVGRLVPASVISRVLSRIGLERAAGFVRQTGSLTPSEMLDRMLAHAPGRTLPFLLRNRYIALIVVLNLPGNFLLGGGGGIAMMAGLCRLYAPLPFLFTVAIAVAPVPLAFLLMGR